MALGFVFGAGVKNGCIAGYLYPAALQDKIDGLSFVMDGRWYSDGITPS